MSLKRSTVRTLTTGALVVALGVAAGGLTPTLVAAADSDSEIEGAPWVLDQLVIDGELGDVPDGVVATLLLEAGQASGSSGCNSFIGTYILADGSLTFGPPLATAMLCPDPAMATEATYLQALGMVASFETDRSGMQMLDGSGNAVLVFEGGEASPIEGSWIVSSYANGDGEVAPPIAGSLLTAVFGPDGTLEGSAGCNHFAGSYTVDGSGVTVGALNSTKVACASPELQQQETDYLAALSDSDEWSLTGTDLALASSEGLGSDTLVTFTAAIEPSYIGTWDVTGYDLGNGSIVTPSPDAGLSATFSVEGTIEGSAGCNTYSGPASVSGWSMTLGPLATTRMACASTELETQEQQYLAALHAVAAWAPDADGIVLLGLDGAAKVTLAAPREELVPRE